SRRELLWSAAVSWHPPDLLRAAAVRSQIDPLSIAGPAGYLIVEAGLRGQRADWTAALINHVDMALTIVAHTVVRQPLAIRRPPGTPLRLQGSFCSRGAAAAVGVCDPDLVAFAGAIRRERHLGAIRRKGRIELVEGRGREGVDLASFAKF